MERLTDITDWLSDLVESFPYARYVVTTRPTGVRSNWLQHIGFKNATLQPMLRRDIRTFIELWHQAAAQERGTDSRFYDFDRYKQQLIDLVSINYELHEISTNPLLCAVLCTLNLRSRAHLPLDKLEFYDAVITMLLERRDAERGIYTDRVPLSYVEKVFILRDLAYWLVRTDNIYISMDQAIQRIDVLTQSLHDKTRLDRVLKDLLQRSGLLVESAPGELGFIHQGLQEYLAAGEAVSRNDINFLVESAENERYRNLIILAAGQANIPQRQQLVLGIIRQGDQRPDIKRYLVLLALGCASKGPVFDTEAAETLRLHVVEVLPPRSWAEEKMLEDAGPSVLEWLHVTTDALNTSYERGALSAEALQMMINEIWREMRTSPQLEAEITAAGFNRETLPQAEESPITVHAEASGVDPTVKVLTVTFAASGGQVFKDLWATIILPRIRQRLGDDAIGVESRIHKR